MKVKITKCTNEKSWYVNFIGQEFEVVESTTFSGDKCFNLIKDTYPSSGSIRFIRPEDCEIIK